VNSLIQRKLTAGECQLHGHEPVSNSSGPGLLQWLLLMLLHSVLRLFYCTKMRYSNDTKRFNEIKKFLILFYLKVNKLLVNESCDGSYQCNDNIGLSCIENQCLCNSSQYYEDATMPYPLCRNELSPYYTFLSRYSIINDFFFVFSLR
jgi:hypothetical protein